jgi:hypothetical protein
MTEDQLREMLRTKAEGFNPASRLPERLVCRTRARRAAQAVGSFALVAFALLAGVLVANRISPSEGAFAAFTVQPKPVPAAKKNSPHRHDVRGPAITTETISQHARCMRAHGVNVPDPVPTAEGWMIPLRRPAFDPNSKAWREAFFVDCRLVDVNESFVIGGRTRGEIDKLVACTRAHGLDLPQPVEGEDGEFTFNLNKASPPWGSDAWYRTVFVTCAPARAVVP